MTLIEVAAIVSAVGTLGILWVGIAQLENLRDEARAERTLKMCFAYDSDPEIAKAVEKLRTAIDEQAPASVDKHYRSTVLNYLDVLAIGVNQGHYDFGIVFSQFKKIIPEIVEFFDVSPDFIDYEDLKVLTARIEHRDQHRSWFVPKSS